MLLLQGMGFYVGIAFWPGGRVEDWLPAYDSDTQAFGLNPCNTTNDYNNTALSDAQYLVSPCRLLKSAWCHHSNPLATIPGYCTQAGFASRQSRGSSTSLLHYTC